MSRYDAIVIGAGVNGLVAGAVLARRGKSVCILEAKPAVGGMASLAQDGGPALAHLVHNLSPSVRRDIGLDALKWPFKLTPLPTMSLDPQGRHVVLRGQRASYADGGEHAGAQHCRTLLQRLTSYGALLRHLAELPPPGGGQALSGPGLARALRLARFGIGLRGMGKPEMRRFLQVLLSNSYDLILDEIPDGPLAGLLAADAVRGTAMGPGSPGTVFSLIYRMGHGGIAARPDSGMNAVMDSLAGAARDAGCRIETATPARRILVACDRVTGVETDTGDVLEASRVLSSAAPQVTADLTGLGHFDIEATRRLRNVRARGTAAKINLALARAPEIPGLPQDLLGARMIFAPSADYVERAFNPAKYSEMSEAPAIEAVMPDPHADRPWLSLIMQYAPADLSGWTDAARDRLLKNTLDALARVAPDLPGLVEEAQVLTPDLIEAATAAPSGHWHHAELSLDQLLTLRPGNGMGHYAFGPAGLYLCGAATHPGGDVMGLAGRNAALKALEDAA